MYVWALPEWPNWTWDEGRIAKSLAMARHRQGLLLGRMQGLGFGLREEATLTTLTQDVVKTSEIEGEKLDPSQVRSSIARRLGMEVAGLAPADRHVEGVVEMMLDATQNFAAAHQAKTVRLARRALSHRQKRDAPDRRRRVARRPRRPDAGRLRPGGKEKAHFVAPPADRLDAEVATFLDWFNARAPFDPVLASGLAHLWFVTIHPFADGNGRIARAVADMASRARRRAPSASTACRRRSGRSGTTTTTF